MKINITEKKINKKLNFFKEQVLLDAVSVLVISIGSEGTSRVVHSYLSELEKVEDSINYYLTKKNITEINKIGHRYKTISQTIGAVFLVDLFRRLEQVKSAKRVCEIKREIRIAVLDVKVKLGEIVI